MVALAAKGGVPVMIRAEAEARHMRLTGEVYWGRLDFWKSHDERWLAWDEERNRYEESRGARPR